MTTGEFLKELQEHVRLYGPDSRIIVDTNEDVDSSIQRLYSHPQRFIIFAPNANTEDPANTEVKVIQRIIEGLSPESVEKILEEEAISDLPNRTTKSLARDIWSHLTEEFFLKALNPDLPVNPPLVFSITLPDKPIPYADESKI